MKLMTKVTGTVALAAILGLTNLAVSTRADAGTVSTAQLTVISDAGLPPNWPITLYLPEGAEITAFVIQDGEVTVTFDPKILKNLDEALLEVLFSEVKRSLALAEDVTSIRLVCQGQLLSSYLPKAPAVGEPPPPPGPAVAPEGIAAPQGLGGRNITIGPSHGRFWNGSVWAWQRTDPCGLGEAVLEDTNSIRLMQFLYQYLVQDGAVVHVPRELNESNCCHSATGLHWWKMAARYWLQANGLPSWVWDSSTTDLNDDIRARPLYADYRGSDIYVSHHTNAGGGTGTETYRDSAMDYPAHEANSLTLANNVNSSVVDAIRNMYDSAWVNRGVKDSNGGFGEIRIPNRPAILIELAFHDKCDRDAPYLTDNFFRSVSQWGIYRGICQYFGTSPTWDKYSCEIVSDTIPTVMTSGQVYPVSITFRNRGVLWTTARSFRLGAVGDSDPFAPHRHDIVGEVRPGATYTWNFNMTAPAPGSYVTDWRMVRDGVTWFGPTLAKTVTVNPAQDTTPPTTPTNLTATALSPTSVQLNWTASTDNVGVVGYDIRRNGVIIASSPTNSYTDNSVSPNTAYAYEVRARDAVPNYSGWSNTANVTTPQIDTTPPSVPTNLVAVATSPTSVQLNWTASTDNVGVTGYDIRRNGAIIAGSPTNSYTDNAASPNTSYTYEVRAKDANNNLSGWSSPAYATTPSAPVVVFQDGFDGSLNNWIQQVQNYDYSTAVNRGGLPGAGAAYMGAGQSDQMYYPFARPFAQGKVRGYFWDGRGGWKTGVCGWAYRQSLSLREPNGTANFILDNCLASNVGNPNYYYRLLYPGQPSVYNSYALRDPNTDCNGTWIEFESVITAAAPGANPPGAIVVKVTDRAGTTTVMPALPAEFFSYGIGRITLGLGVSSANEGYWDDISFEANPPGIPTMSPATVLSETQIRWNFAAGDANFFGWDIADAGGTVVSPSWPNAGWVDRNATSWTEGGLTPNTLYSRKARSWNGTLNSAWTATVSGRTLSPPPVAGSVTADNNAPCAGSNVTWTAVGGFGAGKVEYYRYAWNQSATYSFTGGEPVWSSGSLALPASAPGTWYLHVQGFNADHAANGTFAYSVTAVDCSVPPLVTAAVSRKVHGAAGPFQLNVAAAGAVEGRSSGPTQVVVTFDTAIAGLGGLDPADVNTSSGTVTAVSIAGNELTISLSGVSDQSVLVLTFPGIVAVGGTAPSTSTVCFGALVGDINADKIVNILDLVTVRNNLNAVVGVGNFRSDVNTDGTINILDLVTVRNSLGRTIVGSCP